MGLPVGGQLKLHEVVASVDVRNCWLAIALAKEWERMAAAQDKLLKV